MTSSIVSAVQRHLRIASVENRKFENRESARGRAAMILRGDKTWPFVVKFTGTLPVDNAVATWFGGDSDPQDKGQTARGYPTNGHPDLLGCSLPMDLGTERATEGSPIPRLPFGLHSDGTPNSDGTIVIVWPFGQPDKAIELPLISDGPAKAAAKNPKDPHVIDDSESTERLT